MVYYLRLYSYNDSEVNEFIGVFTTLEKAEQEKKRLENIIDTKEYYIVLYNTTLDSIYNYAYIWSNYTKKEN